MPDAYRRAIQAIRNLFPGRQVSVGINPVEGYGSLSLDGSVNMIIRPDRNTRHRNVGIQVSDSSSLPGGPAEPHLAIVAAGWPGAGLPDGPELDKLIAGFQSRIPEQDRPDRQELLMLIQAVDDKWPELETILDGLPHSRMTTDDLVRTDYWETGAC